MWASSRTNTVTRSTNGCRTSIRARYQPRESIGSGSKRKMAGSSERSWRTISCSLVGRAHPSTPGNVIGVHDTAMRSRKAFACRFAPSPHGSLSTRGRSAPTGCFCPTGRCRLPSGSSSRRASQFHGDGVPRSRKTRGMSPPGSSGSPVVRNACSASGENRSPRAHTSTCLVCAKTLVCGSGERTPTADERRRFAPQPSRGASRSDCSVRGALHAGSRAVNTTIPGTAAVAIEAARQPRETCTFRQIARCSVNPVTW